MHASEKNQSSRPNKPGRRALVERNSTPYHEPHDKQKVPSPFQVPIWHFKWNSDCKQNQLTKIAADSHQLWIREWVQTISRFDEADGVLRGPWNGLPKAAWPRLPKKYGSGRYPFRTE